MPAVVLQESKGPFAQAGKTQGRARQENNLKRNSGLRSRSLLLLLLFGGSGFALEVTRAAFSFQHFVGLLSHNSLLCSRDAVLS